MIIYSQTVERIPPYVGSQLFNDTIKKEKQKEAQGGELGEVIPATHAEVNARGKLTIK